MSASSSPRLRYITRRLLWRAGFELRRVAPAVPSGAVDFYQTSPTCQIPTLPFLLEFYFGRRTTGTFVEVGAFDGYSYSNTSCLAEVGWQGMYLEPVPAAAELCRSRYSLNPNITVHELAIGALEGSLTIRVGGALSTSDAKTYDEFQNIEWAKSAFSQPETVTVKQTTLDLFLQSHGVKPNFELLVVDVEGFETEVFAGFSLDRWLPKMMIVELTDTHPDLVASRNDHAKLSDDICRMGYVITYKDVINTVFVARGHWLATFGGLEGVASGTKNPQAQ